MKKCVSQTAICDEDYEYYFFHFQVTLHTMFRAFVIKRVGNLFQTCTVMHSTIPAYARTSDQNDIKILGLNNALIMSWQLCQGQFQLIETLLIKIRVQTDITKHSGVPGVLGSSVVFLMCL